MNKNQNPNVNINLKELPTMECEYCGNKTFKNVAILKKISKLVSPDGREQITPIPLFACDSCSKVPSMFMKSINEVEDEPSSSESTKSKPTLYM